MRLLILLILLPFIAQGQIVRTHPYYRPTAAACSYLLDQYSGAAAAYSLRKLDCDYAGSAIRVRRSSDNTEQDIGFVNGNLDTATLKTFVGTGGSDDGFVVTWYDQSGNANNGTQSTSANQPLIVDNGVVLREGTLPCIKFDGSNDYFNITAINGDQPFSSFMVQKRTTTGSIGLWISTSSTDFPYTPVIYISFGLFISHSGATKNGNLSSENSTARILLSGFATASTTYEVYKNGSSLTLTLTGSSSTGSFNYIGRRGASEYSNATGQEIILYKSNQTTNRTSIESNINAYYSIY